MEMQLTWLSCVTDLCGSFDPGLKTIQLMLNLGLVNCCWSMPFITHGYTAFTWGQTCQSGLGASRTTCLCITFGTFCFRNPPSSHTCDIRDLSQPFPTCPLHLKHSIASVWPCFTLNHPGVFLSVLCWINHHLEGQFQLWGLLRIGWLRDHVSSVTCTQ